MTAYRAADLPEGSVVATDETAWIKTGQHRAFPWRCTDARERIAGNGELDQKLGQGAQVLRVGTGKED